MPYSTYGSYKPLPPDEEEKMIENAFNEVLQAYVQSNHRRNVEIIEKAFRFAKNAHKGARRRSGEPYILHPIAVAKIVISELGLGSTSICAALLHDVIEDTDYSYEDIRAAFGESIASIVDGLTKISGGIFGAHDSLQAENFRKLLLSMSTDVRVVLIKMADRLHNMRTLGSMRPEKQLKIAGETLYVYAPLAHRLGLHKIKTELEDLAFRYEHPQKYADIMEKITETEEERDAMVKEFVAPIREKLDSAGFKYEIKTRVKSAYSIQNKIDRKKVPFEEIYDLYAVRIIFDNDDEEQEQLKCYQIYSFFTNGYRLHPERTRDWISSPKPNGYRAFHLTAMSPRGKWVEVQIRSRKMDEIAELGYAAHWKYKAGVSGDETELDGWMNTVKDILANPEPNALDFLDTIKLNLFSSEIYVFTPKGDLKTLPKGATVLDLAFAIHTELGMQCMAGKVNHKLVTMSHPLESGDQVEIITSESQKPQKEWLRYARTARALSRIKNYLRRERGEMIAKGELIFKEFLNNENLKPGKNLTAGILAHFGVSDLNELYLKLGRENIVIKLEDIKTPDSLKRPLYKKILRNPFSSKKSEEERRQSPPVKKVNREEVFVLLPDAKTPNYIIDDCCKPIPGDDVVGFVNDDEQVVLHKTACPNAMRFKATFGSRLVATRWGSIAEKFLVTISIDGLDRRGLLADVIQVLTNELGINIRGLNIYTENEVFHCKLSVKIDTSDTVNNICARLRQIKNVKSVNRTS